MEILFYFPENTKLPSLGKMARKCFFSTVDIFASSLGACVRKWGCVCLFVPICSHCMWGGDWMGENRKEKAGTKRVDTEPLAAPVFFIICER